MIQPAASVEKICSASSLEGATRAARALATKCCEKLQAKLPEADRDSCDSALCGAMVDNVADLIQKACSASQEALRVMEQLAPLTAYHLHFARLHHRHLCRLSEVGDPSSAKKASQAALELFATWMLRHGALQDACSLGSFSALSANVGLGTLFIQSVAADATARAGLAGDTLLQSLEYAKRQLASSHASGLPKRVGTVLRLLQEEVAVPAQRPEPSGHLDGYPGQLKQESEDGFLETMD